MDTELDNFVWAIKNGELDAVREFVEQKRLNVNDDIKGRFPLHYAADYGHKEVLEYLIAKGANVNVKDKHEITALLAAIYEGHTDCVRILLQNGADKNGRAADGSSYSDAAEKDEIKQLLK